jgi:RNAse (barnase) inhibitor barstar
MLARVTVVYVVDGSRIECLEDFWVVMGEAVNGPGGYFGKNLDALHDCLRGGFGTPHDGDFIVEWHHHEHSEKALGYPETVRQLELTLERCHPSNRSRIRRRLEAARKGKGETVFDWLTGIFAGQIPGRLHLR